MATRAELRARALAGWLTRAMRSGQPGRVRNAAVRYQRSLLVLGTELARRRDRSRSDRTRDRLDLERSAALDRADAARRVARGVRLGSADQVRAAGRDLDLGQVPSRSLRDLAKRLRERTDAVKHEGSAGFPSRPLVDESGRPIRSEAEFRRFRKVKPKDVRGFEVVGKDGVVRWVPLKRTYRTWAQVVRRIWREYDRGRTARAVAAR